MCAGDLADMYAWAWWQQAQGQVHTYQPNQECTCYNSYVILLLP